jgi:hypothetical protein
MVSWDAKGSNYQSLVFTDKSLCLWDDETTIWIANMDLVESYWMEDIYSIRHFRGKVVFTSKPFYLQLDRFASELMKWRRVNSEAEVMLAYTTGMLWDEHGSTYCMLDGPPQSSCLYLCVCVYNRVTEYVDGFAEAQVKATVILVLMHIRQIWTFMTHIPPMCQKDVLKSVNWDLTHSRAYRFGANNNIGMFRPYVSLSNSILFPVVTSYTIICCPSEACMWSMTILLVFTFIFEFHQL